MAMSSVSGGIFNELYYLYLAIAILVGGLVLAWLGYILVKFRARPGTERPRDAPVAGVLPAERGHPIWSYVMALVIAGIMFGLAFGTISAVTTLEVPPEPSEGVDRIDVNVTGFQFGWRLTQYGEGGIPIGRIQDWTIPVDTAIAADVKSQDVWHNFALPEFRIRIDVIPGQTNHIWWQAHETGQVYPVCVQLCGNGHALMKTNMFIVTKEEWRAYIANESRVEYEKLERAGQVANLTFDGSALAGTNGTVNVTKPYGLRVTSTASAPTTLSFAGREFPLTPGQTLMVYAPANTPFPVRSVS